MNSPMLNDYSESRARDGQTQRWLGLDISILLWTRDS